MVHEDRFEGLNYRIYIEPYVSGTYFYKISHPELNHEVMTGKFVKI